MKPTRFFPTQHSSNVFDISHKAQLRSITTLQATAASFHSSVSKVIHGLLLLALVASPLLPVRQAVRLPVEKKPKHDILHFPTKLLQQSPLTRRRDTPPLAPLLLPAGWGWRRRRGGPCAGPRPRPPRRSSTRTPEFEGKNEKKHLIDEDRSFRKDGESFGIFFTVQVMCDLALRCRVRYCHSSNLQKSDKKP